MKEFLWEVTAALAFAFAVGMALYPILSLERLP